MVMLLGGSLNKKSMKTIPFKVEMRTLAYVMIHNLYPVTNLNSLSAPRTIFLYDLYTHKEIDICGHIFHLLTKSITKRNSRTIMPFPSLIMGLIAKSRLKIPSSLTIVPRDYPIGANMVTWSKAHITGSRTGVSQIPRDNVEEEGGNTEEEIDRFTSAPEGFAQPSSQAQAWGSHLLDHLIARIEQVYGMLDSHVLYTTDQYTPKLLIWAILAPLAISVKKGEKVLRGSCTIWGRAEQIIDIGSFWWSSGLVISFLVYDYSLYDSWLFYIAFF